MYTYILSSIQCDFKGSLANSRLTAVSMLVTATSPWPQLSKFMLHHSQRVCVPLALPQVLADHFTPEFTPLISLFPAGSGVQRLSGVGGVIV